jgi:hypothetical protein
VDDLTTYLRQRFDERAEQYSYAAEVYAFELADLAAKRDLLREHQDTGIGYCGTCVDWMNDHLKWPCRTVLLLAYPYENYAGFRDDWRLGVLPDPYPTAVGPEVPRGG